MGFLLLRKTGQWLLDAERRRLLFTFAALPAELKLLVPSIQAFLLFALPFELLLDESGHHSVEAGPGDLIGRKILVCGHDNMFELIQRIFEVFKCRTYVRLHVNRIKGAWNILYLITLRCGVICTLVEIIGYLVAPTLETELIEILRAVDAVRGLVIGALYRRAVRVGEALTRADELADLMFRHAFTRAQNNK